MSDSSLKRKGGSAAKTLPLTQSAAANPLPSALREHLQQPHLILPVIANAVAALRRQNAGIDADVSYELTVRACEPLEYEIDRIECLLAPHARQHRQLEVQA